MKRWLFIGIHSHTMDDGRSYSVGGMVWPKTEELMVVAWAGDDIPLDIIIFPGATVDEIEQAMEQSAHIPFLWTPMEDIKLIREDDGDQPNPTD